MLFSPSITTFKMTVKIRRVRLMGKSMFVKIRKIVAILLIVCFIASIRDSRV